MEREIANLKGDTLPGETVFQLYDTYGFPADLTADVVREHELKIDMKGFQAAMDQQRSSARAASNFGVVEKLNIDPSLSTDFTGYDSLDGEGRIV